jgi:hypothetical protein
MRLLERTVAVDVAAVAVVAVAVVAVVAVAVAAGNLHLGRPRNITNVCD